MSEFVRSFIIPPNLSEESIAQLSQALEALPAKQGQLAAASEHVLAAREVRRQSRALELRYDVPGAKTAGDVIGGEQADLETLLDWAGQLCSAFAVAYPTGESAVLRHGGLCPAAVIFTPDNKLRILDFGVAECFASVLPAADESWLMQVAGNVAPEVWNAPGRFGVQSDVFAVGVLLYELATGKHPFGAIRDEPDDCKYQILVEVPVPPDRWAPDLGPRFSELIARAIRSAPERRTQSFQEMLQALEDCRRQEEGGAEAPSEAAGEARAVPVSDSPEETKEADPVAETGEDPEQKREQYLQEQARLKRAREETEEKQAQRRQRTREFRSKLRRHAVALSGSLIALAVVSMALFVYTRRAGNVSAIQEQLEALSARLNEQFATGEAGNLARSLGIEEPSPLLVRGLVNLRKVAPQAQLSIDEPIFSNLLRSRGSSNIRLASVVAAVDFVLGDDDEERLHVVTDPTALRMSVVEVVDALARAQLDDDVGALTAELLGLFRQSASVAELEERLGALLTRAASHDASGSLGYLGYQGRSKTLELGPFEPVPGEKAVQAEAVLLGPDGKEIFTRRPALVFGYECRPSEASCRLIDVTVLPETEPLEHRSWCVNITIEQMRQAFDAGDAESLAALANPDEIDEIKKTIAWANKCQSAELGFEPVDLESDVAHATIHFKPGLLPGSELEFDAGRLRFEFSDTHQWGVVPSARQDWPKVPPPFLRQQLGVELLNQLRQAFQDRDAQAYKRLFAGTRREVAELAEMFAGIDREGVSFEIEAREDEASEWLLFVDVKSDSAEQYPPKSFEFVLEGGRLEWNPTSSDPMWIVAGDAYQRFVRRLEESDWQSVGEIETEFLARSARDMSSTESGRISEWIDALKTARGMFEARSEEYVSGFPKRAALRKAPAEPMSFQLVTLAGSMVYMLDREVRVGDIASLWTRADRPWELWRDIVGRPPAEQVVGLTLPEARKLAGEFGCEIPTLAEWQAANRQLENVDEMDFQGGVWEFCADDSQDGTPIIVGGCWHDDDPELTGSGVSTSRTVASQARFGTIGFRLCKRFAVPGQVVAGPVESGENAAPAARSGSRGL